MRRATKLTDARTIKLPESVTQAAGWTSGQRLVPIVEGKSVVLVAIPEFGATKGIARADADYYDRYRERSGAGR
jgi:hypothetical protein